eukprot:maker-scaffold_28-snap-gene-3.8-mRNA-1 protein AED:0.33 eAED:0.36 QI:0/0/0/1/0.5/0.33/3/0/1487
MNYLTAKGYKLLEVVRVLHWVPNKLIKSVRRYMVLGRGISQSRVSRQKHKNVFIEPHGTVGEVARLMLMAKSLQGGAISVYPQISVGNVPKTLMNLDGHVEVRFIKARRSLSENLTLGRRLSNEDARGCSTANLYTAWERFLDDGLGDEPKSFNVDSWIEPIQPTRIYASIGSLDLVERINSGNLEGIDFGEVIKLRRHVEDIADDNLGDNLLPDMEEGLSIEDEEPLIKKAIIEMVDRSEASIEMKKLLRKLCLSFWDVFATDHTQTKISGMTPMPVYPLENFEFNYPRVRPMSAEKSNFIRDKLLSMAERGLVTKVKSAEFGSVVFAMPKKGNKLRMVVVLVDVNKILRRDVNQLPHLETCFDNLAGSKYYGSFDVVSGFDQLGITEEAKKYFDIVSKDGTFQLQFAPITPVFFHQRMVDEVVGERLVYRPRNGVIQWIDDSLLYVDNFDEYLKLLETLLTNLRKARVLISPAKSIILAKEIVYCGRRVANGKWNFKKEYYSRILDVPRPEYVYQLASMIHLSHWLSLAIPELAELRSVIMEFYPEMRGKKSELKRKNERVHWSDELTGAFERFLKTISIAAKQKLSMYDRTQDLLLITDASAMSFSSILMQANTSQRDRKLLEKRVVPMMFFSGKFQDTQTRWGIVHKELYPIVKTFNRLSYLLPFHPTPIQVYTDHLNLRAIIKGGSKINHGHLNRLQRWVLTLQQADVELHHIKGEDNVFADMLSRWAATPEREKQRIASIRIIRAAIRRDRTESDVSLGPQLSLTSRERKYYRRMFRHPLDIEEESNRWTPLKDKYTDSDSDSFDTGTLHPWYQSERVTHGLRPDGGLEIKIEKPSLEEEYSRLALVDTESSVSLDEIGTWVSSQMIKSENSSSEDVKIEVPRVGLGVLVSELRLSPKKQKEKLTFERMRALDKDRISCLNPYYHGEWKRISEKELLDAQKREALGDGLKISEEEGRIIIPKLLFERQLVHIHLANRHGSRMQDMAEVRRFKWKIPSGYGAKVSAETMMLGLRSNCTHCNRVPKLIKTNLRLITEARRPKEVLVADFLYVNAKGYILVITDAFSRFCFLHYAPKADAGTRLEVEFTLVTDRGSHFANQLLELLQKEVRFTHNYAVSYASWTNGEVEIVHRKVLSFLRSLVSEFRLQWDQWPDVIESVMTAVNEVPLPSRKLPGMKDAPSADLLFLNTDPTREYIETEAFPKVIYRKIGDRQGVIRVDKDILYRLSMEFRRELDEMHSQVADYVSLMKRKRNDYWNKRQKRVDKACIQYVPGDWCLISTKNTPRESNKIKLIWSGPVNVIELLSSNVYKLGLLNGETQIVHGSRLYFYEPDGFVPDDSLRKVFINNWGELEVQKFLDIRYSKGEYFVRVRWRGFEPVDDTREPLLTMYRGVKEFTLKFLGEKRIANRKKLVRKQAQAWLDRKFAIEVSAAWVGRLCPSLLSYLRGKEDLSVWAKLPGRRDFVSGWKTFDRRLIRNLILKFGM